MSGLLDLHVEIVLRAGWKTYGDDFALFKSLMPQVKDSYVQAVFNRLQADPPTVIQGYGLGRRDKLPIIAVELLDESEHERPLGGLVYSEAVEGAADTMYEGLVTQPQVRLTIAAKEPDVTRLLHVWCMGVLTLARRAILKEGYDGFGFISAPALEPEEALVAERARVLVRRQLWGASSVYTFAPAALGAVGTLYDWMVILADPDVDNTTGYVEPS